MREIIVTGATGFIGRNIVPELCKLGYKVCLITRDKDFCKKLFKFLPAKIIEWDIKDGAPKIVIKNSTTLLHMAWEDLPNYESIHHIERNFTSSYALIKGFVEQGISSVVVTGTCLEYGMQSGCLKVNDVCNPITPYGLAKHSLHKSLLFLQNKMAFDLAWARLFYITGEGQSPNAVIPQLDSAIDRNDLQFNMSKGEQLRDYLPVKTVVDHLTTLLIQRSNGTFNISSGTPISIRQLVENRIKERKSNIKMNLGYYPYSKHEPMAFWGQPNTPKRSNI